MTNATLETKIWEALRAKVNQVSTTLNLPVVFPNVITLPTKSGYILVNDQPNNNVRPYMGSNSQHIYTGILQLDLMMSLGQDTSYVKQVAGQIVALFPEDTPMVFDGAVVRVTKAGDIKGGYRDDTMWRTPILIYWRCVG